LPAQRSRRRLRRPEPAPGISTWSLRA
jgi:hypothetical protein